MRSYDEYRRILQLWEQGFNKSEIENKTGIPRTTIGDCVRRYSNLEALEAYANETTTPVIVKILHGEANYRDLPTLENIREQYAYLLGLYLGDGSISKHRRDVYRLRIACFPGYTHIIELCKSAIETLLPENQVGIVKVYDGDRVKCINVSSWYKHWPEIFPQHGPGKKYKRKIALELWQQQIVNAYPLEFFRGLYHSDGSRFSNIVNGKDYPRYQFTNVSTDIIGMFCEACNKLNLHWTHKTRLNTGGSVATDVYISKRRDVEFLDGVVGPKS